MTGERLAEPSMLDSECTLNGGAGHFGGARCASRRGGAWDRGARDGGTRGGAGRKGSHLHIPGLTNALRLALRLSGRAIGAAALVFTCLVLSGCVAGPQVLPVNQRKTIDRTITEYPSGFELKPYAVNLNTPTGFCFDDKGAMFIAEGGIDGADPHIFGLKPDNTRVEIYPTGTRIPLISPGFRIYGPVGGIAFYKGRIYVSHRDKDDMGVITAFGYDGTHTTIVAGLPAQGDYSVTDIVVNTITDRLYFGLGATTNSGVVGLDNWEVWVGKHGNASDIPYKDLVLLGYRFDAHNPNASIFSGSSIKVTVPFEPFGISTITHVPHSPFGKPTGAIYSVAPDGGDLRVEAWGVRNPAGLAINPDFGTIYFTDQGMEMRGTRPIYNDPDGLFKLYDEWYGWPDYSRRLEPISRARYQVPPNLQSMVVSTGYPDVGFVIDHAASGLRDPATLQMWRAEFLPLSGASKIAIVPSSAGPLKDHAGDLIVALWGNRAPFATSDQALIQPPPGYKLVRVSQNDGQVKDFVYNIAGGPASGLKEGGKEALERPIDVKFGPDGNLYILDFGYMRMKDGQMKTADDTGKIFVLMPETKGPATAP